MNNFIQTLDSVRPLISDRELSERAGVAQQTISRWRSKGRVPNLMTFNAVLNACGYELTIRRLPNERR